jgi:hypothetical protein
MVFGSQNFERFPDNGFTTAAIHLFNDVQLLEVVVDKELAHEFPVCCKPILGWRLHQNFNVAIA